MYGFYGLKHHIVEISGDVTDAGRDGTTSEDRATQLLIWETLSLAITMSIVSCMYNMEHINISELVVARQLVNGKQRPKDPFISITVISMSSYMIYHWDFTV